MYYTTILCIIQVYYNNKGLIFEENNKKDERGDFD